MILCLGRATTISHVRLLPCRFRTAVRPLLSLLAPLSFRGRAPLSCARIAQPVCKHRSTCHWRHPKGSRRLCTAAAKTVEVSDVQTQLSSQAPRGTRWRKVKQWVVFSDLHLSHKTLGTVLKVLERVHQEAVHHDAGILFLGAQASAALPQILNHHNSGKSGINAPHSKISTAG